MKKLIKEFIDAGYPILFEKEQGMYKCCLGKQKTCGGFKWVYKEDYEN